MLLIGALVYRNYMIDVIMVTKHRFGLTRNQSLYKLKVKKFVWKTSAGIKFYFQPGSKIIINQRKKLKD